MSILVLMRLYFLQSHSFCLQQSGFLDKLSFWELNLATTGGQAKSWKFHEFHGFFFLVWDRKTSSVFFAVFQFFSAEVMPTMQL